MNSTSCQALILSLNTLFTNLYHCAVFEKDWVFAYEVFDEGVIVRDMANTALLAE